MWYRHHDNVQAHTVSLIQELFTEHLILVLAKPPYSPDLSPPNLFPFPQIKMTLKGRFHMVEDIITNMKDELRVIKKHL
jgi:hypothetical protein